MDKDSEIRRLREFIRFYLRREIKGDEDERSRIQLLFKESSTKSRKSQEYGFKKNEATRSKKNQFNNDRNKERTSTLEEEIGRNYHSTNNDPYNIFSILDDIEVSIFPIAMGSRYQATIKSKSKEISKTFPTEEEAQVWSRNNAMKLSNKFTQ